MVVYTEKKNKKKNLKSTVGNDDVTDKIKSGVILCSVTIILGVLTKF